jgi:Glycosyl hydrolase family 12/Cellulose binding domain
MAGSRRTAGAAVAILVAGGLLGLASPGAQAATTQLCQMQLAPVAHGVYEVQNNEWGSGASECITTDGGADFTVANSSINAATNGAPGGYPSIFQGCHWGTCSSGGLTATPIQASAITAGKVTTSWSTTQPGSGAYDVAYDIWFNQTPTTSGQPNGTELMIWLNHNGPVQPFGSQVATGVTIGGRGYNVWEGAQGGFDTVSYTMTTATRSVSGLDLAPLVQDMVSRGYTRNSWYLIDIEAGFELWQGGAGLATNAFAVNINGAPPVPATCSATYTLASASGGTFQANLAVKNTTSNSPLNGWTLTWTFPGDQKITDLWNGVYTQSGKSVTVTNASYNGTIAPGGTTSLGFNGTYSSSNASPTSVTCS